MVGGRVWYGRLGLGVGCGAYTMESVGFAHSSRGGAALGL